MDDGIAEVRERARHAGVTHLSTYSDFEPAEANFFPGSGPARLADDGKIRRDAMIEHVGNPTAQAVVLTGFTLGWHRWHATPGKGQHYITFEWYPSRAEATRRFSEDGDHAFGISRAKANDVAVVCNRAVGKHVRTQFRPNPGNVCARISTQMGVYGRIQE